MYGSAPLSEITNTPYALGRESQGPNAPLWVPILGSGTKKISAYLLPLEFVFNFQFGRTLYSASQHQVFSLNARVRLLEVFRLLTMEMRAWKAFQNLVNVGTNS